MQKQRPRTTGCAQEPKACMPANSIAGERELCGVDTALVGLVGETEPPNVGWRPLRALNSGELNRDRLRSPSGAIAGR